MPQILIAVLRHIVLRLQAAQRARAHAIALHPAH